MSIKVTDKTTKELLDDMENIVKKYELKQKIFDRSVYVVCTVLIGIYIAFQIINNLSHRVRFP